MKRIAITGGTGFVGRHFAQLLRERGDVPVILSRREGVGLDDVTALAKAFAGCDAVAHLAGINREIGSQSYDRVHVQGTRNVIEAARMAGVKRIEMLSFLRARPGCGSAYHESKFAAEEIVRGGGIEYTILKSGVIYGRGDHLLDHLSHSLFTAPLFATGLHQPPLRPIAVMDLANVLHAALVDGQLMNQTVAVLGPDVLTMREIVTRVAEAIDRRVWIFPMPVIFHKALAWIVEQMMAVPLLSTAQARMLAEGLVEAAPACDELPETLRPRTRFTCASILAGLPEPGPFTCRDLRLSCCARN